MALIVLDASVVIALLDPGDTLHDAARAAMLDRSDDDLLLPASAYAETLVVPARRGHLAAARVKVAALGLRLLPIAEAVAERAAELRAQHDALRLPDALVLACGDVLDASTVLTGDRRWASFERVRVLA